MKAKILEEIYNYCGICPNHDNCPEEACVLFRIEQIIIENKGKK